jgi:hypothetical protein
VDRVQVAVADAAVVDDPAADHERRRALLRDCVQRAIAP